MKKSYKLFKKKKNQSEFYKISEYKKRKKAFIDLESLEKAKYSLISFFSIFPLFIFSQIELFTLKNNIVQLLEKVNSIFRKIEIKDIYSSSIELSQLQFYEARRVLFGLRPFADQNVDIQKVIESLTRHFEKEEPFVNLMIKNGQKNRAYKIFYKTLTSFLNFKIQNEKNKKKTKKQRQEKNEKKDYTLVNNPNILFQEILPFLIPLHFSKMQSKQIKNYRLEKLKIRLISLKVRRNQAFRWVLDESSQFQEKNKQGFHEKVAMEMFHVLKQDGRKSKSLEKKRIEDRKSFLATELRKVDINKEFQEAQSRKNFYNDETESDFVNDLEFFDLYTSINPVNSLYLHRSFHSDYSDFPNYLHHSDLEKPLNKNTKIQKKSQRLQPYSPKTKIHKK
jgi:ribosomal protein S7